MAFIKKEKPKTKNERVFVRESRRIPRLTRPKRKREREFEMLLQNGRKSASL